MAGLVLSLMTTLVLVWVDAREGGRKGGKAGVPVGTTVSAFVLLFLPLFATPTHLPTHTHDDTQKVTHHLSPLRKLKSRKRLGEILVVWRRASHQEGLGVPSEGVSVG